VSRRQDWRARRRRAGGCLDRDPERDQYAARAQDRAQDRDRAQAQDRVRAQTHGRALARDWAQAQATRAQATRAQATRAQATRAQDRAPAQAQDCDRDRAGDRGSASLEYLGVLPILLLVALAGIQLGIAAYAASEAGTAARAAARAEAKYQSGVSGRQAGADAVSSWLGNPGIATGPGSAPDSITATATIKIPSVIPLFDPGSVSRSATMPKEDTTTP